MNKTIIKAPCVNLASLETLFIEMTAQNCNLKCKHCYIDFKDKKVKDFIQLDKVKQSLCSIDRTNLKYIHLTGAEPMLHPDFNHILRLCLKYSSVIIHTNAMAINDKKARFLRKVEEENNFGNEIKVLIESETIGSGNCLIKSKSLNINDDFVVIIRLTSTPLSSSKNSLVLSNSLSH